MKIEITDDFPAEEIVKEMFWLAWQACGGPLGMGVLQNNPGADRDAVWDNVQRRGDYPSGPKTLMTNFGDEAHGDYVFGRMMKLYVAYGGGQIDLRGGEPTIDYQAWCGKYPSYKALFDASVESLKEKSMDEKCPIIINEDGQIIDGHHGVQALINLSKGENNEG